MMASPKVGAHTIAVLHFAVHFVSVPKTHLSGQDNLAGAYLTIISNNQFTHYWITRLLYVSSYSQSAKDELAHIPLQRCL